MIALTLEIGQNLAKVMMGIAFFITIIIAIWRITQK